MTTHKIQFFAKPWSSAVPAVTTVDEPPIRIEPSVCEEAETFALRVLDDSMVPEFRQGCIILVDPTGHARDGSYVLARVATDENTLSQETDGYVFRQLRRSNKDEQWKLAALNSQYPSDSTAQNLSDIVGVIVQRAGTRRRYHKHYN